LKMFDKAERLFLRAMAIREKDPGEDNKDLITTLDNLAFLYMKTEKFREAEALYRQVLELRETTLEDHHPDIESSFDNLQQLFIGEGNLRKKQDRFDEAIAAYLKALDIMKNSHPEAAEIASLEETLAVLSVRIGDLEEAVSFYERLIILYGDTYGAHSIEYAHATRDLARVYVKMERYEQAVPLYESVVEIQSEGLDSDAPELIRSMTEQAMAMTSLAKLYLESGKTGDAVPLLSGAIEIRNKAGNADDPAQAVRMNNLAGLLIDLERYEEAEHLYSEALEVLGRSPKKGRSHKTLILQNMKQLYSLTGEIEKATVVDSILAGTPDGP
ncbi:MAG: tetratricopeptide repeat protein, partial [Candidatus Krumholzibacteria bacterium]|nr:tetratricopeptide repeat protein [Candidatus Krumholzibacteria bacterium]